MMENDARLDELKMDAAGQSGAETMRGKYLTFWTEKQLYGIPIADVVQIVGVQEITQIPDFPYYAKGIINLRGSIIPVIDVRLRFGKEEAEYNERTCIIVTNIHGMYVGFVVDSVDEVTDIDDEDIAAPPRTSGYAGETYLTGIGKLEKRVVLLLDTQRMLSDSELSALSQG